MSYIPRIICYNRIASIAGFLEFLGFFIEKPINYIEILKKSANFIEPPAISELPTFFREDCLE